MCQLDADCSGTNQVCEYDSNAPVTSGGTCTCAPGVIEVNGVCTGKDHCNLCIFCGVMFAFLMDGFMCKGNLNR